MFRNDTNFHLDSIACVGRDSAITSHHSSLIFNMSKCQISKSFIIHQTIYVNLDQSFFKLFNIKI